MRKEGAFLKGVYGLTAEEIAKRPKAQVSAMKKLLISNFKHKEMTKESKTVIMEAAKKAEEIGIINKTTLNNLTHMANNIIRTVKIKEEVKEESKEKTETTEVEEQSVEEVNEGDSSKEDRIEADLVKAEVVTQKEVAKGKKAIISALIGTNTEVICK